MRSDRRRGWLRSEHRIQRLVLQLVAGFGALGLAAAAAAVGATIASVHQAAAGSAHLEMAGLTFSYPRVNGAEWLLLGLGGAGLGVIATALRTCWRQWAAYREVVCHLRIVDELAEDPPVRVIADPRPQAFCAGYLRPAIYVSQRALDLLSKAQLEAVLAHERHHRQQRDPLRMAGGRALERALFYIPALRSLCARYGGLAELGADAAAVRACRGDMAPLAAALLAFEGCASPMAAGISPERVDSLLGEPVGSRLPWWGMTASLGALLGLVVMIWWTSESATARATLGVPFLSSRPCIVILTGMALLALGTLGRSRWLLRRTACRSSSADRRPPRGWPPRRDAPR